MMLILQKTNDIPGLVSSNNHKASYHPTTIDCCCCQLLQDSSPQPTFCA
jgi:hypothetical protein